MVHRKTSIQSEFSTPRDLAALIYERWPQEPGSEADRADLRPDADTLTELIRVCFQASLLREEARPVTFRLILAEPGRFPAEQGPPLGLHRLELGETRPLNPLELRRLSPAANVQRSMIGVRWEEEHGLRIWGIIHSGLSWLQNIYGGRGHSQQLPQELVITVRARSTGGRFRRRDHCALRRHTDHGTVGQHFPGEMAGPHVRRSRRRAAGDSHGGPRASRQ